MPAEPEGLAMALWFDFSSMRPDEFYRQRADRWRRAKAMRDAYLEGVADAASEAAGDQTLKDEPVGMVG